MAHQHSPRFVQIVEEARKSIHEISVQDVRSKFEDSKSNDSKSEDNNDKERFLLVDVREESEFAIDHLPGAIHLGKGTIERDIEERVPDLNTQMILYCGGGFRSALATYNLQKMGYTNVFSMAGGIRAWREHAFPVTSE